MATSQRRRRLIVSGLLGGSATLALPSTALLAWWNAYRDVYADTGLTTPAADGGAVAGWKDQGSSALHVTQNTAGDRPIYRKSVAALNNKPAVEFVSNDFLIRTGLSGAIIGNLNVYSIYVVFVSSDSIAAAYFYSEGNSGSATQFAAARHNLNAYEAFHRDDASVSANPTGGTTAANGAKHLLTIRRIASNSWSVRADGVQVATAANAPTTTTINQVALGVLARNTNSLFYIGHLAQVACYSADNFATIEPLLAAHYGIALP